VWRSARNSLIHLLRRRPSRWRPLLAVYYLTYACDFRCPYCSDGAQNPYYSLRAKVLRLPEMLELLRRIRACCDYLVITGGEPLKHPDFAELMQRLPRIGFDGVILTTNGYEIGPHLTSVVQAVSHLIFSVDTLDAARAEACYGVPGAHERILQNLERAFELAAATRSCRVGISAVATPDNLDGLLPVYELARRRGLLYALCPQLCGVKAHPALHDNAEYRVLFDTLIAEKKRGGPVNGTVLYLEHMRDLRKFDCRPSTMLAVAPDGGVHYPCLEIGHIAGNLLATADLDTIRAEGLARFGPEPACDNRCHSACALGFALAFGHPLSIVDELYRLARARLAVARP
jgi:MoaA/NifB/PqqE/SkfB family radical SAM enzyme